MQRCSEKFPENYWKRLRRSLFKKTAEPQQVLTGDCFSNLLQLLMVFGLAKI